MAKNKNNKAKIQTFISREDVSVTANIEENYILTTEDKIKILYNEYNDAKKYSGEFWTFLGIFLALLTTILTCEFKDFFGVSSYVIEAIFIIATIISIGFCIYSAIKWVINRKKLRFEYFINRIRGDK